MQKPPIGIMPKKMWDEIRMQGLADAINRYNEAKAPVPYEWAEEYMLLVNRYSKKSELDGQEEFDG